MSVSGYKFKMLPPGEKLDIDAVLKHYQKSILRHAALAWFERRRILHQLHHIPFREVEGHFVCEGGENCWACKV